ncbi:MAG: hypothetical protein EHM85_17255 [Desulfobacteraceae bacterium]|nr:MAG: hypothetical protein EHM85_17255 [Desulfobacteraceae bacterium]
MRYKLLLFLLITFCGCAHPYIGQNVTPSVQNGWRWIYSDKESCEIKTEHINFMFTVERDAATGEYLINGYMEPAGIKSFSNFHTAKSNFNFVFADNGVITDVVSFMPMGFSTVKNRTPIKLRIKTKPFNAITVQYEFYVS